MAKAWASHAASFLAGVVLAVAVGAGAGVPSGKEPSADRYAALDTFAQALATIGSSYVEPQDERALLYDAIRGMLGRLDRHSRFYPPRRYQKLRQDTEGEFGGVGITLSDGSGAVPYPVIADVVDGSPAARAGILPGDRLLAVDGAATATATAATATAATATAATATVATTRDWDARLRGPAGSRISLRISSSAGSGPTAAPRDLSLVRAHIKVPTVVHRALEPGIGYIGVRRFQEATSGDVAAALAALSRPRPLTGLVLDLRGNPGGLVDQAVKVADLFLDHGTIVTVKGRGTTLETDVAHAAGTWTDVHLAVLVDQGSASAAEIVAAALQDQKRALVVGSPSFGKGSVQTFIDLVDGSGLKLTTARYYTPSGRSLEGGGITPDLPVAAAPSGPAESPSSNTPTPTQRKAEGGTAGAAPRNDARMWDSLGEDPQFHVAYQTVKRWPGSK